MSLDTKMVSIHPHFTVKDGKMDQCIALLEEILGSDSNHGALARVSLIRKGILAELKKS